MGKGITIIIIVAAVAGAGYWRYTQPLPVLKAEVLSISRPAGQKIKLPWASDSQAALGAIGYGLLESNKADDPAPIASIAKVVTALAVLQQKPLLPGHEGPAITLTAADEQIYRDYLAKEGSVFPVTAGGKITERDALMAMLIPSANNIADALAKWAFGSLNNYLNYANRMVQDMGMSQTRIADASGFSPKTVSTATDLLVLASAVLKQPLVADIVSRKAVSFPGIKEPVHNVNYLLGTDGIIGIKTGNSDQAKGCYLFAAKRRINGQTVTITGAVLGAKTRDIAMADARKLIQAANSGFAEVTVVNAGQAVGRYNLPWGGSVEAVASSDLSLLAWKGQRILAKTELSEISAGATQNTTVGTVKTTAGRPGSASVKLNQPVPQPSFLWRILR